MGKKNVFSQKNGEDEEQSPREHEQNQDGEDQREEERKSGMDVPQSHHGDIPEEEDENEEKDTGKDKQSNEDSLLGLNLQRYPRISRNIKIKRSDKANQILTNFWLCYHKNLSATPPSGKFSKSPKARSVVVS